MASCTIILAIILCVSVVLVSRSHFIHAAEDAEKLRIVIDTDAGTDDAVAILTVLSDPYYGRLVEGITCVRGNTEVDKVCTNVLKILKIANRLEVPVYLGSTKGVLESPAVTDYFGEDGMGDANYPEAPPLSILQKTPAAEFLAKFVNDHEGEVTILCLGPTTNIAIATRLNPKFMSQVKNVIGLLGSTNGAGNMRPGVEFNAFMDPHAASVIMQELSDAGRKMTLIPTDAIRNSPIDKNWRINTLGVINNAKVDFMNRIEKQFLTKPINHWDTYDVYIAAAMIRPEAILESKPFYCDFETQGQLVKGLLVVDYSNMLNKTANAEVVFKIDKRVIKSVCLDNLSL